MCVCVSVYACVFTGKRYKETFRDDGKIFYLNSCGLYACICVELTKMFTLKICAFHPYVSDS